MVEKLKIIVYEDNTIQIEKEGKPIEGILF